MQNQSSQRENLLHKADALLAEIADLTKMLDAARLEAEAEIERARARHGWRLRLLEDALKDKERDLFSLMKRERAELFAGDDKVRLPAGVLIHEKELRVQVPRGALERLEELGWTEAIRIKKAVAREVLERWPEERLIQIGAKRRLVERFAYEVKRCQQ